MLEIIPIARPLSMPANTPGHQQDARRLDRRGKIPVGAVPTVDRETLITMLLVLSKSELPLLAAH